MGLDAQLTCSMDSDLRNTWAALGPPSVFQSLFLALFVSV